MTPLPNNWPVNWMEQALYVAELQRRIIRVQKVRKSIVLRGANVPSRAQFEAAYVAQTGYPLPIEPGTKLMWFDTLTGQMKGYSTAYDQQNGEVSSGDIYPMVDVYADSKGAIRLIGVHSDANGWNDPFSNTLGGGLNLRLDPTEAMKAGLDAHLVLFQANSSSIPFSYTVRAPADGGVSSYAAIYNVTNAAGSTINTAPGKTLVTSGNTTGMSELMCQGMAWIGSAVDYMELDGTINEVVQNFNLSAPNGVAFASGFLTSLAANSLRISQMTFIEQKAASAMIEFFDPDFEDAPTTRANGARAWLYGLYHSPTYSLAGGR